MFSENGQNKAQHLKEKAFAGIQSQRLGMKDSPAENVQRDRTEPGLKTCI